MYLLSALRRRLLRLSLFAKILIANSAIVALGATIGTYVTTRHVMASPHGTHYEMMALFAAGGLALSLGLNALVLRTALLPLARLERTARRVSAGHVGARARLGAIGDPDTDRLATTFNAMLDSLAARAQEIQAYATRLQELSDRVLLAQEEERRRLARELHDDTGQVLSTLLLHLKLFRDAAGQPGADAAALRDQASGLAELARDALDGIRRLALELRPRVLDDLGLAAALRAYVDEWRGRTQTAVALDVVLPPDRPLPNTAEIAVYRMIQEALANVARHARATRVGITLVPDGDRLVVEVRDNGKGIDAARPMGPLGDQGSAGLTRRTGNAPGTSGASGDDIVAAGLGAGLGLFGMQERIGLAGGTLHVESVPGQGTTLRAVLPLPAAACRPSPPLQAAAHTAGEGCGQVPRDQEFLPMPTWGAANTLDPR
jgi:two-component system sensor histidine kinase UhpB